MLAQPVARISSPTTANRHEHGVDYVRPLLRISAQATVKDFTIGDRWRPQKGRLQTLTQCPSLMYLHAGLITSGASHEYTWTLDTSPL